MRPGWQTTEFWVTLAALAGAVYLFAIDKPEAGAAVLGLVGAGYVVARSAAKRGNGKEG